MTLEQKELFEKDPFVKAVLELSEHSSIQLVGGSVIDILEKRKPKDYDLIGYVSSTLLKDLGLVYQYETKTAKTYRKDKLTVQILKTEKADFDFKISEATLTIHAKLKKLTLSIDEQSFENKMLIPCDRCWTERRNAMNTLHRIVHWAAKGYKINGITYLSLLGVVGNNNNINS